MSYPGRIRADKSDFDKAADGINYCRKTGLLPINITAKDATRATVGIEAVDLELNDETEWRIEKLLDACDSYHPVSFWEDKEHYIEVFVEKIDLAGLFKPVCDPFYIPITNVKG